MEKSGLATKPQMVVGAVASRREVDMDNLYSPSLYSSCMHRHIQVIASGIRTFYAGEVWDDICEKVVCLDCFSTLSEIEVRETWAGHGFPIRAHQQEE